ncbi:hypothetical protein GCM10009801_76600 [Streptomyces albiaxialis]|uniref:Uncharacterized protein n=1 Tax=Streptomyces albiaxialis TaxID=329523 RepID=A0ABP5ILV5_9ACTN
MTDGTDTGTDTGYDGLLDELGLAQGACVTAVAGADEAEVIRCFGGDPDAVEEMRLGEKFGERADLSERQLIAVSTAGPAVVVVEYEGFQGVREEVLRPLSRLGAGRAAGAYWNVDALSELALAEDGSVLSSFEMLTPEQREGKRPGAWDAYLEGLAFGVGGSWGDGVAAVARATGARLDAAWAAGPHRVVVVDEVPEAVLPQGLEDSPLLREEPFARYLAELGPGVTAAMERDAVELAAVHHGIARQPLCTLALAVLDGCGPPEGREGLRAELAAAYAAERNGGSADGTGGSHDGAGLRAEVWQVLGDLLARDAGAGTDVGTDVGTGAGTTAGPPPMFRLSRAMTTGEDTEEIRRFRLLHALHDAAERAGRR